MQSDFVADAADMQTPQGVYDAVHFVCRFCCCEPCVVTALANVMVDYLRTAPQEIRGPIAEMMIELVRNGVRESLQ